MRRIRLNSEPWLDCWKECCHIYSLSCSELVWSLESTRQRVFLASGYLHLTASTRMPPIHQPKQPSETTSNYCPQRYLAMHCNRHDLRFGKHAAASARHYSILPSETSVLIQTSAVTSVTLTCLHVHGTDMLTRRLNLVVQSKSHTIWQRGVQHTALQQEQCAVVRGVLQEQMTTDTGRDRKRKEVMKEFGLDKSK